jgi:RNA polymerase sigma-70 factor (ECF subfamily)
MYGIVSQPLQDVESGRSVDRSSSTDPERWVERHGDAMYRFALLRVQQPELAAELVQEAFLQALRGRESFAGRSSERTWLIGILKHKILDYLRRAARKPPIADLDSHAGALAFTKRGHWNEPPRRWPQDPASALEQREFWDAFRNCVSKMPGHLADTFLRRELDGMTGEEVCASAGISQANLWARLHRARMLLRHCLEIHWFDERMRSAPSR